jgi:ABC-type multidrug transport system fused ATPase/permease subunit
MKIPKSFSKMLENKYVLYFVLFLTLINLLGYMILGNFNAIIFFILAAFLTANFSKNMIVVLSIPLILTSVFMVGKAVKEGFEEMKPIDERIKDIDKEIKEKQDKMNTIINEGINTDDDKKMLKELRDDIDNLNKKKEKLLTEKNEKKDDKKGDKKDEKPTEKMSTMYKKENRIDYASTVEDAYDDLNKILGGNGIKQLTDDTQNLMKQQLQLADAMKSMTPLMEQAQNLLQGFDMKSLSSLAGLTKTGAAPIEQMGAVSA